LDWWRLVGVGLFLLIKEGEKGINNILNFLIIC